MDCLVGKEVSYADLLIGNYLCKPLGLGMTDLLSMLGYPNKQTWWIQFKLLCTT
uniref:GST C-terminal domain-containing protein n=1 Tax=Picea glauca TaxID=3330 RepID=A0A101LU76_PICGL|nr:hypothetical protein ABT39_MTgene2684 [Picea glauca]